MAAAEQLITENLDIWTSAVQTKSAGGRGKSNKLELYGIKKLRELILELAVRGLLVPQDPNDEPASELLKKIAAERAQLIKEGKVKKTRSPSNDEVSPLFDIPASWEWARLLDIGSIFNGNSVNARTKSEKYTGIEGLPYIATKDVGYGFEPLDYANGISIPIGEPKFKVAQQGAVLICSEGGSAGKKCGITGQDICFGNKLYANQLFGRIEPNYILSLYLTPSFFGRFTESMTGIIGGISTAKFMQLPAPVPPLAEQARIVAKVDELMALCDQLEQQQEASITAHQNLVKTVLNALTAASDRDGFTAAWARIADHFDTLFTTEWSIDQLKQTILQLAVMGKLVPQDPNDEPASGLLKKIAAEKEQLVKDGKIKRQKVLPAIGEDEKPFELPAGWEWCRLDDLALSSEAGWSPRCDPLPRENGNWGVLKVSAVTWGTYKPEENKALPSNLDPRENYEVQDGDFLISRANTAELVARAVVVPERSPSKLMMSDKIIRFRFSGFVNSHYVNLVNSSDFSRAYYAAVAGGTSSSMKNVSREQIRSLLLPVPPKAQQVQIVGRVGQLISLCGTLKSCITMAQAIQLQLADALAEQAIT